MVRDAHGLEVTAASAQAVQAFDHALAGYLGYRADTPTRMAAVLDADPAFGLAHCLKGYFAMLAYKQAAVPIAEAAAVRRTALHRAGNAARAAHVAALRHWIDGEPDRALSMSGNRSSADHPRDILAFRLAHFVNFWLGRPDLMLASVDRRRAAIGAPSCQATTRSSAAAASRMRSAATTSRPRPRAARRSTSTPAISGRRTASRMCWRCRAGAARASPGSTALERQLGGRQQPRHHLWWHAAMFHLERASSIACWRCTTANSAIWQSRLTAGAARPLHRRAERRLDAVPAATTRRRRRRSLGRARRQGRGAHRRLPVGVHLAALDDGAGGDRARRGGTSHAGGDARSRTATPASPRRWSARYALPICRGGAGARARRPFAQAVAAMRPALGGMYRLGGSHAQQDVLEQLFLDCGDAGRPA